jgi:hypothetical protein
VQTYWEEESLQVRWLALVADLEAVQLVFERVDGIVIQLERAVVQDRLSSYDGCGESVRSLIRNH